MASRTLGLAALAAMTGATAWSLPLEWVLNNVQFNDAATATGYYVFDAFTDTMGTYDITVSGGIFTGYEFDNSDSSAGNLTPTSFHLTSNFMLGVATSSLQVNLHQAMTDAGGTLAILNTSNEVFGASTRFVATGQVTSAGPVFAPEPSPALPILGGLTIGAWRARRRRITQRHSAGRGRPARTRGSAPQQGLN